MNLTHLKRPALVRLALITTLAATTAFASGAPLQQKGSIDTNNIGAPQSGSPTPYLITVKMKGKPVAGAQLTLVPAGHPDAAYTLPELTQRNGKLSANLPEGSFTINATSGKASGSIKLLITYSATPKNATITIK